MKVIDCIAWPPSNWGGSVPKGGSLRPDFESSILKSVFVDNGGGIHIDIESEGRKFTPSLDVINKSMNNQIVKVLSSATGKPLMQALELNV